MSLPFLRTLDSRKGVFQFLQVTIYATDLVERGHNLAPQCLSLFNRFVILALTLISQQALRIQSLNEIDKSYLLCRGQVLAFVASWFTAICN